ncbi:helix-turn-helix domain-containing protein [Deinococcus yavapaiensis]|nr:AraC family transcriptional regulator [Deinococcus yavapaiensis]
MVAPSLRLLHESSLGFFGTSERGALSLKTMRRGAALYEVGRARYRVDDDCFLVLNDHQPYAVDVDRNVESFCVFFHPAFAAGVLRALRLTPAALLDAPFDTSARVPELLVRTYPQRHPLGRRLRAARLLNERHALHGPRVEQLALTLLDDLYRLAGEVRDEAGRLPWARAATREETYRRVQRARDYAEASLHAPVTLAELADVANLAPHHFLRAFKVVTGETPHAFLTRRRLERARRLLREGMPVGRAALDVGFSSPTSFTAAYKQRFGAPPSHEEKTSNSEEVAASDVA